MKKGRYLPSNKRSKLNRGIPTYPKGPSINAFANNTLLGSEVVGLAEINAKRCDGNWIVFSMNSRKWPQRWIGGAFGGG